MISFENIYIRIIFFFYISYFFFNSACIQTISIILKFNISFYDRFFFVSFKFLFLLQSSIKQLYIFTRNPPNSVMVFWRNSFFIKPITFCTCLLVADLKFIIRGVKFCFKIFYDIFLNIVSFYVDNLTICIHIISFGSIIPKPRRYCFTQLLY